MSSSNPFTMKDLHQKLNQIEKDELILDVRGPEEFKSGHIPGSRNIPHDQVGNYVDELRKYKRVYVHCQAGRRASVAVDTLSRAGLTNLVCISQSGMGEWIQAGFPTEK